MAGGHLPAPPPVPTHPTSSSVPGQLRLPQHRAAIFHRPLVRQLPRRGRAMNLLFGIYSILGSGRRAQAVLKAHAACNIIVFDAGGG